MWFNAETAGSEFPEWAENGKFFRFLSDEWLTAFLRICFC